MGFIPTWPFSGLKIGILTIPDKINYPDPTTMVLQIDSYLDENAKSEVKKYGGLKQCILAPFTGGTIPPFTMNVDWFGNNTVTYECLTAFFNFLSISALTALKTQFGITQTLFSIMSWITTYYLKIFQFLQFNPADEAFKAIELLVSFCGSLLSGEIRKCKDSFYNTMRENGIKDPEQVESWPWEQFLDCPPVKNVLDSYQENLDSHLVEYNRKKYEYKRSYALLQDVAIFLTWIYFKISILTNWLNSIDIIIEVKKRDPLEDPWPGKQRQADRPPSS